MEIIIKIWKQKVQNWNLHSLKLKFPEGKEFFFQFIYYFTTATIVFCTLPQVPIFHFTATNRLQLCACFLYVLSATYFVTIKFSLTWVYENESETGARWLVIIQQWYFLVLWCWCVSMVTKNYDSLHSNSIRLTR